MNRIKLDYTFTLDNLSKGAKFLSKSDISEISDKILTAHYDVINERKKRDELSFLSIPEAYYDKDHIIFKDALYNSRIEIINKSDYISKNFSDYIQLAIGGSALGAISLVNALGSDLGPDEAIKTCKIHHPDNIDPEWIGQIMENINIRSSFFCVISKSGGTVETLASFYSFFDLLKKVIPATKLKEHIVIMTNPQEGPLAELCKKEGFTLIPIPDSIHGRFSVLSPSGLLTAAVAGVDIDEILKGAKDIDEITNNLDFWENPLLLYSAFHYIFNTKKDIQELVLMPYSHGLRTVADWYSQLVAESLGKDRKGITPIKALGATDQHSQLQIYNEGPLNKFVTIFSVTKFRRDIHIPNPFPYFEDYNYLSGHSLNDLFKSEEEATCISLYNHGVPNCKLIIPEITPYYIGQLFMFLQKIIPILSKLYNVNAFNQPGVEESKIFARAMLGMIGKIYDEKRDQVKLYSNSKNRSII